jgi:hypothetical protein
MEQLPALGTAIGEVAPKTFAIYQPLILKNAAAITSTPRKSFSYGPHSRQTLDVYYPSLSAANDSFSSPILIFFYGGGLVRGSKIIPDYALGLVHANMGHFFASKYRYTAVIADYRLISHSAKYPSGGEDVALVIDWVSKNLASDGKRPEKPRDVFMMGNSAGGVHLSTWLFSPRFEHSRSEVMGANKSLVTLKGVVLLSVPFHFRQAVASRAEVLETYYGDSVDEHSPIGLLKAALKLHQPQNQELLPGVSVLVLNGGLDPDDEILLPKQDFLGVWDKEQKPLIVDMMKGQNHISPALSLGTDIEHEEAWGHQVAKWMESVRGAN